MSKHHLRHEQNCLNCGTIVEDRYCPHCGQENLKPKESIGHLLTHFFNDMTHFDGQLFSTIKVLFTQPGFLSEEYMHGRRASYLNPIRMFLFISFAVFLVQVTINNSEHKQPDRLTVNYHNNNDSAIITQKTTDSLTEDQKHDLYFASQIDSSTWYTRIVNKYGNVNRYDSIQNALPAIKRDGWGRKFTSKHLLGLSEYIKKHQDSLGKDLTDVFFHSLPKALFLSVPLIAFILWLIYIRRRKTFYFVSHTIFVVHLYCAIYLLMLVITLTGLLGFKSVYILQNILVFTIPIYLLLAMKRFYKQGWIKTIIKYVLLLFASSFVFFILLIGVVLNTLLVLSAGGH